MSVETVPELKLQIAELNKEVEDLRKQLKMAYQQIESGEERLFGACFCDYNGGYSCGRHYDVNQANR